MNKQWTLHVEKFAKIDVADIKIAPLMCFVGDNNSGKSYLMSLLWGILTLGKDLFPKKPSESKSYKMCESWLREHLNEDIVLSDAEIKMYISWFNDLVSQKKKELLKRIFNYEVTADKIEIIEYTSSVNAKISWSSSAERYSISSNSFKFPKQENYTLEELSRMNAYICWNLLMEGVAAPLYTPVVKGRRMGEPVYLPASRTGFMLTFPQLIENSIGLSFASFGSENSSKLTLPYVDFLQLVTKFESKNALNTRNKWLTEFIEHEMTMGSVSISKDLVPVINYTPNGIEKPLPLYIASSIVTEISPILLLFKSGIKFKTLIIEEPEAHLHPALQQKMARLIINIVNRNIPVWITTHSDTILQHFNNMIKLQTHKDQDRLMQEFGYEKEDLLDYNDVQMYQFSSQNNGRSKLVKLSGSSNGFSVPTFNDALEKLVKEVYAFQEDDNVL